jgi:hypothetical protein
MGEAPVRCLVDDGFQPGILDEIARRLVIRGHYNVSTAQDSLTATGYDHIQHTGQQGPSSVGRQQLASPEPPALTCREN